MKAKRTSGLAIMAVTGGLLAFEATPATASPSGTAAMTTATKPVEVRNSWHNASGDDQSYSCFLVGTAWQLRRRPH